MSTTKTTPQVWIGCLASYNAGRLIGEWADATLGLEELESVRDDVAAQAIEAAKKAGEYPVYFGTPEEFFLADHEGFPEGTVGEYTSLERVAEIAEALEDVYNPEALAAYMSLGIHGDGDEMAEIVEAFEESFAGEFETMTEYAEHTVFEIGWAGLDGAQLADSEIAAYLDFEMIGRELEMDYTLTGGYVFRTV